MADAVKIAFRLQGDDLVRQVRGRYAWCLAQLVAAGEKGVTPIERPAPRWSHYVFWLRTEYGLSIETIEEPHGGPFRGWHGRYVLRSRVEILERREAA